MQLLAEENKINKRDSGLGIFRKLNSPYSWHILYSDQPTASTLSLASGCQQYLLQLLHERYQDFTNDCLSSIYCQGQLRIIWRKSGVPASLSTQDACRMSTSGDSGAPISLVAPPSSCSEAQSHIDGLALSYKSCHPCVRSHSGLHTGISGISSGRNFLVVVLWSQKMTCLSAFVAMAMCHTLGTQEKTG